MGTNRDMIDLGQVLRAAVSAARRGDVPRLEIELAALRRVEVEGVALLSAKLRGIARAALTHPSFRQQPAAAAG